MTVVLDASAILAFVLDEPGADLVEAALQNQATCAAANWSEVAQKIIAAERDWNLVRGLLESYELTVEPNGRADAEWAARRWQHGEGLSLADRLCLAVGARLDCDVLTADAAWGSEHGVRQIR